jgi:hypothetical protein
LNRVPIHAAEQQSSNPQVCRPGAPGTAQLGGH